MKKVMLLRHASADAVGFNQENDHAKPLDEEGKIDCKNLSIWLQKSYLDIDLIVSSDALRAIETSEITFIPLGITMKKDSSFYLCDYKEIIVNIKELDENINNVVIVGHEPSISDTMRAFVGTARPDLKNMLSVPYQPCTMSFIYFTKDKWKELKEKEGILEGYLTPKSIINQNEKN